MGPEIFQKIKICYGLSDRAVLFRVHCRGVGQMGPILKKKLEVDLKDLIITMPRLRKVVKKVEREIQRLGLYHHGMADTQVYLIPVHLWYGYMRPDNGNIYIPRVSLSKLSELVLDVPRWSILDIVRHEYGHIWAHYNERKLCSKAFRNAFGECDSYDPAIFRVVVA